MSDKLPKEPGIYLLTNLVNGYFYIGSAANLANRKHVHLANLRKGTHHNPKLQAAWNKYGGDKFVFSVLELAKDGDDLVAMEQKWLDHFDVAHREDVYNLCFVAYSHLGAKRSEESRKRISEAQKARPRSPEEKSMSIQKIVNYNLSLRGKPLTETHKERIRKANTGKKATEEARRKNSIARKGKPAPWLVGKKASLETRKKLSDSHKGKTGALSNNKKSVSQFTLSGEFVRTFITITEAAEKTGIGRTSINNNLGGRSKSAGGFFWRYTDDV